MNPTLFSAASRSIKDNNSDFADLLQKTVQNDCNASTRPLLVAGLTRVQAPLTIYPKSADNGCYMVA